MKLTFTLLFFIVGMTCFGSKVSDKIDLIFSATTDAEMSENFKEDFFIFCEKMHVYDRLKPKKRISKIHKRVQNTFLHHYDLTARIEYISASKIYNCVTGTLLYALIFEELEIPYSVVEVPNHVYLMTYPDSEKIAVESTDRKNGIYQWTAYSQLQAVEFLLKTGKITKKDVNEKGVNQVVSEFFYTNESLNFENLAGMYFCNLALYALDKQKLEKGYIHSKKAFDLYPNERVSAVVQTFLIKLLIETPIENIEIMEYLMEYKIRSEIEEEQERIDHNFQFYLQEAVSKRNDTLYLDRTSTLIDSLLTNKSEKLRYKSILNNVVGAWYAYSISPEAGLPYLRTSYHQDTGNTSTKEALDILIPYEALMLSTSHSRSEFMDSIQSYQTHFPFISENMGFQNLLMGTLADWVTLDYSAGMPDSNTLMHIINLERYAEEMNLSEEMSSFDAVVNAYITIAEYHDNKGNQRSAELWIDKAVALDPKSSFAKFIQSEISK